MESPLRPKRITVWQVAVFLPWIVAAAGFLRSFNDNSYLWHVRAGDLQAATGSVITADPFSFTIGGDPWRTQSWLAELAYSWLDGLMGLASTPWITTSMSAIFFVLMGLVAYRRTQSLPSVTLFLVLTAAIFAAFLNPRPVIFSFPLFAAVVVAEDDRRLRWSLPLLMWLWAAVHGSFVIGLAFLGLRALGKGLNRHRWTELVLIGFPTLITAHGWGVIQVLEEFIGNRGAVDMMTEWQHPDLLSPPFIPLLLAILALVWLSGRGAIERRDWWIITPFLVLSVSAARAVPPAWIALAPILARFRLPLNSLTRVPTSLAIGLGALVIVVPFVLQPGFDIDEARFPVEAARHISSDRVFHDDVTGAWIVYTQWPERRIYIDDRAELFGERIQLMNRLRNGIEDWETEFRSFGIEEALLRRDTPLATLLRSDGWERIYADDDFVVLRYPGA